jgi:hypothetical protein
VGEEPAAPEGATPAKVAEPTTAAKVAEPTTTATVAEPATPGAEAGIAATAEPAALATAAPAEDSAPTPAAANDSEPSVGPAPRTADMSFQNPPREDRYSDGGWNFQVAPQDPGVTITATTASGTVTQTGRFYMLSTGNPDGYNFTWTPTNPGDTPQDVVFTATRPDGTTSTMTYRPTGSSGGGTTTPTTPQTPPTVPTTPTYTNLKPAMNDPTLPPPPYDASDTTIGPTAANANMQIINSYWDAEQKGWIVTIRPSTGRLPISASSPDGRMSESYPSGYRWVGDAATGTEGKFFDYRFLFRPNDGLDWSYRYPTITFTATDAAGTPSAITFRGANPSDDGSEPLPIPDPQYFPPTGPNARNNEMQISPTTGPNASGWRIDVKQVPWVTVTAASPNGAMRRWEGTDASTAQYLWTGPNDGTTPIVVLTAHYADGRTSTITYLANQPASQPSGGTSTPTTPSTDEGSHTTLTDVGNEDLAVTDTSSGAYTMMFDGSWLFRVEPRSPGVTITASTGTGAIEQSGRFYLPSTGNPDGYSFRWIPANPGDRPEDVVFTATRPDGTQSTVSYRP